MFKFVSLLVYLTLALGYAYAADTAGYLAYQRGDYQQAIQLWEKEAESGSYLAAHNLGVLHEQGTGTTSDMKLAAKWYLTAAKAGYAPSQFAIARLFEEGIGVPKNLQEARFWFSRVLLIESNSPESAELKRIASDRISRLPRHFEEVFEFESGRFVFVESVLSRCVIALQGRITRDTVFAFDKVVKRSAESGCTDPALLLESPGGNLNVGIELGRDVHYSGFRTVVRNYCASACALVFLGGKQRILMGPKARIGLHQSASTDRWGERSCRGSSFDGASRAKKNYLRRVVPTHWEEIFNRSMSTPCTEISWIRGEDAVGLGIATHLQYGQS